MIEVLDKIIEQSSKKELKKISSYYENLIKNKEIEYKEKLNKIKRRLDEKLKNDIEFYKNKQIELLKRDFTAQLDEFIFKSIFEFKNELINYYKSLKKEQKISLLKEALNKIFKKYRKDRILKIYIGEEEKYIIEEFNIPKEKIEQKNINFGFIIEFPEFIIDLTIDNLIDSAIKKEFLKIKNKLTQGI